MPISEVKFVHVPQYDELSVGKLWPQVKTQKEVNKYLPDRLRKGQTISRPYFFNILNTILPAYVKKLIAHANNRRFADGISDHKTDFMELTEVWYQIEY